MYRGARAMLGPTLSFQTTHNLCTVIAARRRVVVGNAVWIVGCKWRLTGETNDAAMKSPPPPLPRTLSLSIFHLI